MVEVELDKAIVTLEHFGADKALHPLEARTKRHRAPFHRTTVAVRCTQLGVGREDSLRLPREKRRKKSVSLAFLALRFREQERST